MPHKDTQGPTDSTPILESPWAAAMLRMPATSSSLGFGATRQGPSIVERKDLEAPSIIFGTDATYRAFSRLRNFVKPDDDIQIAISPTHVSLAVSGEGFIFLSEEFEPNPNVPLEGLAFSLPANVVAMLCGAVKRPASSFGFRLTPGKDGRGLLATQGKKRFALSLKNTTNTVEPPLAKAAASTSVDVEAIRRAVIDLEVAYPRRPTGPFDRIFIEPGMAWAGTDQKIALCEDPRLTTRISIPYKQSVTIKEALRHLPDVANFAIAGEWSMIGGEGVVIAWTTLPSPLPQRYVEPLRRAAALETVGSARDIMDTLYAFKSLDNSKEPAVRLTLTKNDDRVLLLAYIHSVPRYPKQLPFVATIEHDVELNGVLTEPLDVTVDYDAFIKFAGPVYDNQLQIDWLSRSGGALIRLRRLEGDRKLSLVMCREHVLPTASIPTRRRR